MPGDHEVPAALISRANSASAAFFSCVTATRITAWRGGWAVACGPYTRSAPMTSISVPLKSAKPCVANRLRARASSASPLRCALAAASKPVISSSALQRKPDA